MSVFGIEDRERVRDRVLELAAADERIVAGAVVGSLARGEGDRWSDLDLTFGVADGTPLADVLGDWTRTLAGELDAVALFDLRSGETVYRVFLLPGCLQVDLSFTPAPAFGADGGAFEVLFGEAVQKPQSPPPPADELFGLAVHHALRARFCIERGRYWQAEYWISGVRDSALSLACLRHELPARHGRGFDDLPAGVRSGFADTLVVALERDELLRALGTAVEALLREATGLEAQVARVEPQLRVLTAEWDSETQ